MQALVFTAAGRVELRDEALPVPAPGEVVVSVRASGICGSELHGFRALGFRVPPLIMGHEFAGHISDGARVVVNPLLSCAACPACRTGRPQLCRSRQLLGVHRAGGFAERVSVPAHSVHALPDDVGWGAAALIEPLANAVHAWSHVPTLPERVAVIGGGAIGLVCSLVARAGGAAAVVYERSAARRDVVEKLGFEVAAEPAEHDEFEVVVDAVGLAAARAASIRHSAPGGTAIWLGLASDEAEFGGNALVRAEKRVVGSFAYNRNEFEAAVSLASSLDLSWTTDVPFAESETVFYELAEGRSDIVKAVLVPSGGAP